MNQVKVLDISYFRNLFFFGLSKKKLNIGIFGGSFDPPHLGHLHVSNEAIKKLQLNLIIWLVTPLNPLKENLFKQNSVKDRVLLCKKLCKNNYKIKVIDLESSFSTNYTFFILRKIKKLSKNNNLFWIMGEDNLNQFHHFKEWKSIIAQNKIVVFARGNKSYSSLFQKSSLFFRNKFKDNVKFFLTPKNVLSSTVIRNKKL